MTTSQQRFEHLSFGTNPAATRPSRARASAWFRLILVLAGFAALVVWGQVAHQRDQRSAIHQAVPAATPVDQQRRYDGHGKWGGYMSQ